MRRRVLRCVWKTGETRKPSELRCFILFKEISLHWRLGQCYRSSFRWSLQWSGTCGTRGCRTGIMSNRSMHKVSVKDTTLNIWNAIVWWYNGICFFGVMIWIGLGSASFSDHQGISLINLCILGVKISGKSQGYAGSCGDSVTSHVWSQRCVSFLLPQKFTWGSGTFAPSRLHSRGDVCSGRESQNVWNTEGHKYYIDIDR